MISARLGEICQLNYGKSLAGYQDDKDEARPVRVFGTNGPIGWTSKPLCDGSSIIIGRKGAYRGVHFAPEKSWTIDTAYFLKVLNESIDLKWLYYRLLLVDINRMDTGAAIPSTKREDFYSVPIRVPEHEQQLRIASILTAYDDLIENNRQRIQLLEESARLLYKEWFVHLRFPGHEHAKIINGIPEGWERKTLGEVAKTNKQSIQAKELQAEINYIDIASVKQGRIVARTAMPSDEAPGRARRKASDGDVIWSNVRPNLRAYALVLSPEENDVFSTGFTILSPLDVPFTYLYLFATTDEFVGHLVNHTTGASYPAVRAEDFERAEILVPASGILAMFHEIAEPLFRMNHVLEKEVKALATARDLLLPRVMNGEISV